MQLNYVWFLLVELATVGQVVSAATIQWQISLHLTFQDKLSSVVMTLALHFIIIFVHLFVHHLGVHHKMM